MESRKITIVSSSAQKKYVVMSGAETLAQLKNDLSAANIDYEDMEFMEGLSKTTLIDDSSQLPKDVVRTNRETGETTTTNELVFLLTNSRKKIKSGVGTRRECYDYIKDYNLQDEIKNTFGRNFTQVSTAELDKFINDKIYSNVGHIESPDYEDNNTKESDNTELSEMQDKICQITNTVLIIKERVQNLVNSLFEVEYTINEILKTNETEKPEPKLESPYTDDEIEEMFN